MTRISYNVGNLPTCMSVVFVFCDHGIGGVICGRGCEYICDR